VSIAPTRRKTQQTAVTGDDWCDVELGGQDQANRSHELEDAEGLDEADAEVLGPFPTTMLGQFLTTNGPFPDSAICIAMPFVGTRRCVTGVSTASFISIRPQGEFRISPGLLRVPLRLCCEVRGNSPRCRRAQRSKALSRIHSWTRSGARARAA
jgi:hypothetical protein